MKNYKALCADCACLVEKNKVWCCDELFGQPCADVDECPESIDTNEIAEINEKAKDYRIQHSADKTQRKERKKTVPKVSEEKKELFQTVWTAIHEKFGDFAQITTENKLIFVQINQKKFKIDLIQQRK